MSNNKGFLKLQGKIIKVLPDRDFLVEIFLRENKKTIKATITGSLQSKRRGRKFIVEGDKVLLEISPYDFNRGLITEILPNEK